MHFAVGDAVAPVLGDAAANLMLSVAAWVRLQILLEELRRRRSQVAHRRRFQLGAYPLFKEVAQRANLIEQASCF